MFKEGMRMPGTSWQMNLKFKREVQGWSVKASSPIHLQGAEMVLQTVARGKIDQDKVKKWDWNFPEASHQGAK